MTLLELHAVTQLKGTQGTLHLGTAQPKGAAGNFPSRTQGACYPSFTLVCYCVSVETEKKQNTSGNKSQHLSRAHVASRANSASTS